MQPLVPMIAIKAPNRVRSLILDDDTWSMLCAARVGGSDVLFSTVSARASVVVVMTESHGSVGEAVGESVGDELGVVVGGSFGVSYPSKSHAMGSTEGLADGLSVTPVEKYACGSVGLYSRLQYSL